MNEIEKQSLDNQFYIMLALRVLLSGIETWAAWDMESSLLISSTKTADLIKREETKQIEVLRNEQQNK